MSDLVSSRVLYASGDLSLGEVVYRSGQHDFIVSKSVETIGLRNRDWRTVALVRRNASGLNLMTVNARASDVPAILDLLNNGMPDKLAIIWTMNSVVHTQLRKRQKKGLDIFEDVESGSVIVGWIPRRPSADSDWRPSDVTPEDYYAL